MNNIKAINKTNISFWIAFLRQEFQVKLKWVKVAHLIFEDIVACLQIELICCIFQNQFSFRCCSLSLLKSDQLETLLWHVFTLFKLVLFFVFTWINFYIRSWLFNWTFMTEKIGFFALLFMFLLFFCFFRRIISQKII